MSELNVVVGAQYGSEAKGHVAAWLSHPDRNPAPGQVVNVRVAGPNAGHTVIGRGPDGEDRFEWKLRTVPVAAVASPDARLVIAAGSEIELAVLDDEVRALDKAGYHASDRLIIDSQATLLEEHHKHAEAEISLSERVGSTGKGIGAARADRLMRKARLAHTEIPGTVDTGAYLREVLATDYANVVIEGTQGYGLGLHAGHYPFCTSSDCRAIDFLAMAGISPWQQEIGRFMVWAVARTRPIRVAGNSGPLEGETSWEQLGLPIERTTVTNKVRRVGEWDGALVRQAVQANGGSPYVNVALMMLDQKFPEIAGMHGQVPLSTLPAEVAKFVTAIEAEVGATVPLLGTGPDTMVEVVL